MARRSEEQWKDLKFKIQVSVVLAIVIGTAICVGPGLEPIFLKRARKNLDKPGAPVHMYRIARIEETMRRDKAMEIYREIYINYAGDESSLDEIGEVLATIGKYDDPENYFLAPWLATQYDLPGEDEDGKPTRPNHQTGSRPHPLVGEALLRLALFLEDHKDYTKTRHLFPMLIAVFPGTEVAKQAESAMLRDVQRSF